MGWVAPSRYPVRRNKLIADNHESSTQLRHQQPLKRPVGSIVRHPTTRIPFGAKSSGDALNWTMCPRLRRMTTGVIEIEAPKKNGFEHNAEQTEQ